jgi:prolyl-tRNA editing enzyme YbaK/EbsC (Cys-tRNA(Pro) deacylase)
MSKVTPATRALTSARVSFTVHTYDYDSEAESIGLQAASAHDYVFLNGGQRGLQVRLSPRAARDTLKAVVADVVA